MLAYGIPYASNMSTWKERVLFVEAAGKTRQEIAEYIGLAYSSLNDIVSGATKEPRGMAAVRLYELARASGFREGPKVAA